MKKWLKKTFLLLATLHVTFFLLAQREKKCCEDAGCKTLAKEYAIKVTGLAAYLPAASSDNAQNKRAVDNLKQVNETIYREFMKTAKEAHDLFLSIKAKFRNDGCFSESLPTDFKSNVLKWVAYVGNLGTNPRFPSAEFCYGLKVRLEIGQGTTDIGKNTTGYLGSFRSYLALIPGKKDKCGNKVRFLVGPAVFARGSNFYGVMSSRIAFRVKDISPSVFPLGNLNVFGEYNTSFGNLSYGAIGAEVELGFIGFSISGNNNMKTGRKGFAVNIFYRF